MKNISLEQLKQLLGAPHIKGTPDQVRLLAVRVGELVSLNGSAWVREHAVELLVQWDRVLGLGPVARQGAEISGGDTPQDDTSEADATWTKMSEPV